MHIIQKIKDSIIRKIRNSDNYIILTLKSIRRTLLKLTEKHTPKYILLRKYKHEVSSLNLPNALQEMVSEYFKQDAKHASKLWIRLMAFHLKRIDEAYKTEEFMRNVMDYISKHYTLRFEREEHLEEINKLFPSHERISADVYTEISHKMLNILRNRNKYNKLLSHPFPQDQIQTAIEIEYIRKHINLEDLTCLIEIGAGYGRIPEFLMSERLLDKYIIIDIPPALWVSQTYLGSKFPELKIGAYTPNLDKGQFNKRLVENQVLFISPLQMSFLPNNLKSLAIAVNCLQEMPRKTVNNYFGTLSQIADFFYIKAQKNPHNPWGDSFLNFEEYLQENDWEVVSQDDVVFPSRYSEGILKSSSHNQ